MLAADTLEALGVPRGQYVVKVNNRKVLDGVLESIDLGGDANVGKRLAVLRAIDKYDRLGEEGVRALLGKGRKDESGDFTKGAGLTEKQANLIVDYVRTVQNLRETFGSAPIAAKGIDELEEIVKLARAAGYDEKRIVIDSSVVRGLEYYTGPVFEAELTAPITDDKGQPIRFGSVVSGGRYDGLVERFTGEKVPATGISIGVSRLLFGLQRLGKYRRKARPKARWSCSCSIATASPITRAMAQALRAANIRAELYLGEGGLKAQMKYADKRGAPCVVIQGGDEKAKGEVQIKDLMLGAKLTAIKDRDEYLKKQAEAQILVPEAELVENVRAFSPATRAEPWPLNRRKNSRLSKPRPRPCSTLSGARATSRLRPRSSSPPISFSTGSASRSGAAPMSSPISPATSFASGPT